MYYGKTFNRLYLGTLNNGLNILQLSDFNVAKKKRFFQQYLLRLSPIHQEYNHR
jgi:hypothetical protein